MRDPNQERGNTSCAAHEFGQAACICPSYGETGREELAKTVRKIINFHNSQLVDSTREYLIFQTAKESSTPARQYLCLPYR